MMVVIMSKINFIETMFLTYVKVNKIFLIATNFEIALNNLEKKTVLHLKR